MERLREKQRAFPCVKVCSLSIFRVEYKTPRCLESFFSLRELQIQDSQTPLSQRHSMSPGQGHEPPVHLIYLYFGPKNAFHFNDFYPNWSEP